MFQIKTTVFRSKKEEAPGVSARAEPPKPPNEEYKININKSDYFGLLIDNN